MKNPLKRYILLVSTFVCSSLYAQDSILASAEKEKKEKSKQSNTIGQDLGEKVEMPNEEKKAEEDEPSFTISGSVDTYARTSLGYVNPFMGGASSPSTSFADLKGFSLGMVNLVTTYSGEKAGFVGDLVFGPRGKAAVFGTASGQAIVNQLLVYYKVTPKFTFNLGQFNTFLGYEVISPAVNFHYSTSYMFSWGPFNHTGARADFDLGNGLVAKLAIMNPTDIVEFNPVNTYTLGGQLGYSNDKGSIYFNVLYGDQDGTLDEEDYDGEPVYSAGKLFQADITTGWNISDKFYVGVNTTIQSTAAGEQFTTSGGVEDVDADGSSFVGFAVYPKIALSESFALGLRAEQFMIKKGHLAIFGLDDGGNGNVTEFTLSGNYKTGGLTLIPEIRIDKTSNNSFMKGTSEKDLMPSLTLAAVYKF